MMLADLTSSRGGAESRSTRASLAARSNTREFQPGAGVAPGPRENNSTALGTGARDGEGVAKAVRSPRN